MDGTMTAADALAFARLHRDRAPLIFSSAAPEAVRAAQSRHGAAAIAARIEAMMGDIARGLADEGVRRLAIGGGETSGAVVKALGLSALTIGPEIDPGVPALAAEDRPLAIALKSGNFGADDFYEKAIHVLGGTMA